MFNREERYGLLVTAGMFVFFGLTCLLPAPVAAGPATPAVEAAELANFHLHYDRFFRDYFGCPLKTRDSADCRPAEGLFNAAEWKAARQAAEKVFNLKER